MPLPKIIAALAIHLLVPLLGVAVFLLLCRRMQRAQIPSPPFFACFFLFVTFGGWLLVFLTAIFWEWSGAASLGVFFLMLVAPFVTAVLGYHLHSRRTLSAYHRNACTASVGYSGLMLAAILACLGFGLFVK